jgi:hypothetical protein
MSDSRAVESYNFNPVITSENTRNAEISTGTEALEKFKTQIRLDGIKQNYETSKETPVLTAEMLASMKKQKEGTKVAGILDDITDFFQPFTDFNGWALDNTIRESFDQVPVATLESWQVQQFKDRHGNSYKHYLNKWCNNQVANSDYRDPIHTITGVNSTWRTMDNGQTVCFARIIP